MKLLARTILDRFLKMVDDTFPDTENLNSIPGMTHEKWRTMNLVLNCYRATIDEKFVDDERRRPKISLSEIDPLTLRKLCGKRIIDVKKEQAG